MGKRATTVGAEDAVNVLSRVSFGGVGLDLYQNVKILGCQMCLRITYRTVKLDRVLLEDGNQGVGRAGLSALITGEQCIAHHSETTHLWLRDHA